MNSLKPSLVILAIALRTMPAAPASDRPLTEDALMEIRFDQNLDAPLSLDLPFIDERGSATDLRRCLGGRPAIVVLGYYECPMLCSLVLNGLVKALQELTLETGRDFNVVMISIDPAESPALAAATRRACLKRYGRNRPSSGWHFLTGHQAAIRQIAGETGFRYSYDNDLRQYAHPSGLIIVTPEGRISRYIFGVEYSPGDLDTALRQAGSGRVGSPIRQFILLCFQYQPLKGKYGNLVMALVRASGILTIMAVATLILLGHRRRALRQGQGDRPARDHPPWEKQP